MGLPSLPELLIIMAVLVLLFGAKKLPALGGAIGESIRNFKKGVKDTDPAKLGEDDGASGERKQVSAAEASASKDKQA